MNPYKMGKVHTVRIYLDNYTKVVEALRKIILKQLAGIQNQQNRETQRHRITLDESIELV